MAPSWLFGPLTKDSAERKCGLLIDGLALVVVSVTGRLFLMMLQRSFQKATGRKMASFLCDVGLGMRSNSSSPSCFANVRRTISVSLLLMAS